MITSNKTKVSVKDTEIILKSLVANNKGTKLISNIEKKGFETITAVSRNDENVIFIVFTKGLKNDDRVSIRFDLIRNLWRVTFVVIGKRKQPGDFKKLLRDNLVIIRKQSKVYLFDLKSNKKFNIHLDLQLEMINNINYDREKRVLEIVDDYENLLILRFEETKISGYTHKGFYLKEIILGEEDVKKV